MDLLSAHDVEELNNVCRWLKMYSGLVASQIATNTIKKKENVDLWCGLAA